MVQPEHSMINNPGKDDSVFEHPRMALLNGKHWFYIQRRYNLTPRELQVAKLVCQGFHNGEVAKHMKIRPGTAKTHLRNIYRKIRVKSKIEMLLKFVNDVIKVADTPGTTPPISIIDIQKPDKKTSAPSDIPQKD